MLPFIFWYLTITLAGLAVFPLAYCMLPALPDRGYSISRALGWLLWGYLFWLFTSLGISHNEMGGQLLALAMLLTLSGLAIRKIDFNEFRAWWRQRRGWIFSVEALFLAAFAGWAVVRAANPLLNYTEKPMDLGFINAILRSPTFPPHDPWLSGYAISYYYFGHILVAMLAQITGVPGSVAFNLGIALVFGLSAAGVYGLVYNLLNVFRPSLSAARSAILALFGPIFALLMGNLEGLLDVLHARGLFWQTTDAGEKFSPFWRWLDIVDLNMPPVQVGEWPSRPGWWWWRASRVIQDYDMLNRPREIIDEFPFFSYLLADLHPHVLAMPFAFVAMALALNVFLGGSRGRFGWVGTSLQWRIAPLSFLLSAVAIGAMGFLNLWDFPIYLALFCGGYALLRAQEAGWSWDRLKDFLGLGLSLGAAGFILYLPFYVGFSSQAGGLIPSLVYVTRGAHLWVMFATLLLPIAVFLLHLWHTHGDSVKLGRGALLTLGVLLAFGLFTLLLVILISNIGLFARVNELASIAEDWFLSSLGAPGWGALLRFAFTRRIAYAGGWLTLVAVLAACLGLLSPGKYLEAETGEPADEASPAARVKAPISPAHVFALLLVLTGVMLVLVPEFFYLRDQFGSRMNTIFKFYYQAWLLWAAAAAYGTAVLLEDTRKGWAFASVLVLFVTMAAGLVYPITSVWDKTNGFAPPEGWTLDGRVDMEKWAPNEVAAIDWLVAAPEGVIVEAVRPDGGQYSDFARISAYSGQPTVLGWVGHEIQWRGGNTEIGSRQQDIEHLYTTRDWSTTRQVLERYDIRYVIVGPRERSTYSVYEAKFEKNLITAFRQGDMTIYQVP